MLYLNVIVHTPLQLQLGYALPVQSNNPGNIKIRTRGHSQDTIWTLIIVNDLISDANSSGYLIERR